MCFDYRWEGMKLIESFEPFAAEHVCINRLKSALEAAESGIDRCSRESVNDMANDVWYGGLGLADLERLEWDVTRPG